MTDTYVSRYEPGQPLSTTVPLHSNAATDIDPIDFEIINNRLRAITDEQSEKLREVSGSPIVTEINDFNIVISDEVGDVVSIAPYILTHAGVSDFMIKWTLEHRDESPGITPGDMFICNDPWIGALHQNDAAVIAPIFHDGELFAWTATTLHQVDMGGPDPGGFSLNAEDVYDEPPPTPPLKVVEDDEIRDDIEDIFRRRSREPELFELDLRAQIATNNTARTRVTELIDRYGANTVKGVMRGMLDRAESKFADRLAELPTGEWWQTGYQEAATVEDMGIYDVTITLHNTGNRLEFDVTGHPQVGMINSTYPGLRGGILNVVLPLLCHDVPWSLGGIYRRIELHVEEGIVPNATFPGAVSASSVTGAWQIRNLANVVIAEMLDASDDHRDHLLAGCVGSWPAITLTGERDGEPFVNTCMDGMAGGWGARSFADGVDTAGGISTPKGQIANVETNERTFPILYLYRREATDSGGAGQHRGGLGGTSAWTPHKSDKPITHLLSTFGMAVPQSLGVAGGYPAAPTLFSLFEDTDLVDEFAAGRLPDLEAVSADSSALAPKTTVELASDDVCCVQWSGGGGYGDPLDRDPERVAADVRAGAVSKDAAETRYGVVLVDGEVDEPATERRRANIRDQRAGGK